MKIMVDTEREPLEERPISLRLQGDDLHLFVSTMSQKATIYLTKLEADRIAFFLQTAVQDLDPDWQRKADEKTTY